MQDGTVCAHCGSDYHGSDACEMPMARCFETVKALNNEVHDLWELLQRIVMDYGDSCTTEGCECSMAQAKWVLDPLGERMGGEVTVLSDDGSARTLTWKRLT